MDTEEKPPKPEDLGATADPQESTGGDTITPRTLHEWRTAYEAAQPLATWLRLMRGE